MIIGLVGKKFSGKDTLADYLVQHHGFIKYAFADPIKEACKTIFLLNEEQFQGTKEEVDPRWGLTPREMFQFLGTDVMRKQVDEEFWIRHFQYWYEANKHRKIVVSDCRFQNEVDAILKIGGTVVKLERPMDYQDQHISETGVDALKGHGFVLKNNDSKENLYRGFIENMFL
jgi:hypothetical protein